jgi:predicted dienelactone hydrolase
MLIPGISMSPLEILAVLGVLALLSARWLPSRARRPVFMTGALVVAVAGMVLVLLGLRWQLVPVVTVAGVVLVVSVVAALLRRRSASRRVKWWLALPVTLAGLLLVAATPVAAWAMPVPVYPEPTGDHAVGTSTVQWTDRDRPEPFTEDPDDHRTIVVQFWYPAEPSAPELDRAVGGRATVGESRTVIEYSAEFFGIPPFLLDQVADVRSHAVFGAPVAEKEPYPLVVFSPGLSATRTANTVLAEEWASQGYVVATVDHAFDTAVTFIDGEAVHTRNAVGDTEAETQRITRDNLTMRMADLSFVLTQVERGAAPGVLAGRVDAERAAVAGHSRGAAAALMTVAADPRFAAAIHLDGALEPTLPMQPFDRPVLSMTSPVSAAENPGYIPTLERVLALGTGEVTRVELAGAGHYSFTDAALFFPPLPSLLGTVGRTEGLRLIGETTTAFLDDVLPSDGSLRALVSPGGGP